MNAWAVRLVLAAGAISSSAQNFTNYVENLPPAPDQKLIQCRDLNWEKKNLSQVAGNKVHKKLTPSIKKLLTAARSENVNFVITIAYRTCASQLQLRGTNCGFGQFNLYQKPSNLCNPPTESPGKSLHNEGLAIDFACQGYTLFEASPCFLWLKDHAEEYHLFNLASEPWHWSTTGA